MYVGGWVDVEACPAVCGEGTWADPAAAGSNVFIFDMIASFDGYHIENIIAKIVFESCLISFIRNTGIY